MFCTFIINKCQQINPELCLHSINYVDSPELYLRKMALASGVTLGSTTDVKLSSTWQTQTADYRHQRNM